MGRLLRVSKQRCVLLTRKTSIIRATSKARLATPVRTTYSRNSERPFRPRGARAQPGFAPLSPIHESSKKDTVLVNDELQEDERETSDKPRFVLRKRTDQVTESHQESVSSSAFSCPASCDGSSDMIMPSGVSAFFLDCLSTSSSSCANPASDASLPSPEVFRSPDVFGMCSHNQQAVRSLLNRHTNIWPEHGTVGFSLEEELMEVHVRNSTLLNASHAVDINLRQPPNLSTILDISRERDEKDSEKRFHLRHSTPLTAGSSAEAIIKTRWSERQFQPGNNTNMFASFKQPKKIESVGPMNSGKKVNNEPVIVMGAQKEITGSCEVDVAGMVSSDSPTRELQLCCAERSSEVLAEDSVSAALWKVNMETNESKKFPADGIKTIVKSLSQKKARLFDFKDDMTKNAVLQKKEKDHFVFPSKPLILVNSQLSGEIHPVYVKFKNSETHDPDKLHEVCWLQLLHEGEAFYNTSRFKKTITSEGVVYEDYGKMKLYK